MFQLLLSQDNKKNSLLQCNLSKIFGNDKKDWVLDIVQSDGFLIVKVIENYDYINPYKEFDILNKLFEKFKIENYGFQQCILTQIISIKKF